MGLPDGPSSVHVALVLCNVPVMDGWPPHCNWPDLTRPVLCVLELLQIICSPMQCTAGHSISSRDRSSHAKLLRAMVGFRSAFPTQHNTQYLWQPSETMMLMLPGHETKWIATLSAKFKANNRHAHWLEVGRAGVWCSAVASSATLIELSRTFYRWLRYHRCFQDCGCFFFFFFSCGVGCCNCSTWKTGYIWIVANNMPDRMKLERSKYKEPRKSQTQE